MLCPLPTTGLCNRLDPELLRVLLDELDRQLHGRRARRGKGRRALVRMEIAGGQTQRSPRCPKPSGSVLHAFALAGALATRQKRTSTVVGSDGVVRITLPACRPRITRAAQQFKGWLNLDPPSNIDVGVSRNDEMPC